MIKVGKGYTLIELLVVVIIVGVLATLVVPRYFGQSERAIVSEAVAMLGTIRAAEVAYQLEYSAFTTNLSSLDIDTPDSTQFTFTVNSVGAATALRSGGGATFNSTTIILDVAGSWSGTHPYVPSN